MSPLQRTSRLLAKGALVLWASGIAGAEKKTVPDDLVWPPGNPHVRLERLIQLTDSSAGGLGKFLSWFSGRKRTPLFERPYGVAWLGDDLLVTDPGARRVVRITPRDQAVTSPEGAFETPIGVAVCSQGLVVTDASAGKVALYGPDMKRVRWIAQGLERPTGVACVGERVFVVETGNHRVMVGEPDGSWRSVGERGGEIGEFNFPTSVAVARGSLWVGDTLNFRIQRLDEISGVFDDMFGKLGDAPGDMPRIKGLAVDRLGNLWVSDAHLDRVSLYTSEGDLLMSLGGTGVDPGQFSFPAGIAAHPDGRVAVVDSLNRRVQIFRLLSSSKDEP